MRNCVGSEVGRQEDVTSQSLGGPGIAQLGATLRSISISAAQLAFGSSHSRVSSDPGTWGREERRTEWKDWRGSLRGLSFPLLCGAGRSVDSSALSSLVLFLKTRDEDVFY